ncbi:MAG: carbamoyltransferase C-terminal domain-containing protein [Deltaproteobacteria bacterium]|nr:carbamoyltransferase C-terminal domain-containing protein [Deltaproteobacteria bacterium]
MYVLGFNCYVFNSAAVLLRDGVPVAAAQQERFDRNRHTGEFPKDAIAYCLAQEGIGLKDVDHVAFHWRPFHDFHRRLGQIARGMPASLRFWNSHGGRWWNMIRAPEDLRRHFPEATKQRPRFWRVRHHLCHGSSAFFCAPFDEAAILTVDGSGEMATTTLAHGRGSEIETLGEVYFPHSLGYLYVSLTHYLGFKPDSDEYKVMALSALGQPTFRKDFEEIVTLEGEGSFRLDLDYFGFQHGIRDPWVSPRFIERFGPLRRRGEPLEQRHYDIAFALQKRVEDVVLHLARGLKARTGSRNLAYAGGVALNSVLNTRLREELGFDEVFVQPGANDAGTALGAALYVWRHHLKQDTRCDFRSAALGPAFPDEACQAALAGRPHEVLGEEALLERTAKALAAGKVVGWFQGRMEFGPRALGHRSILADPRPAEMKDRINAKVKHREGFRPFAPAVPLEEASTFFDSTRPSPFMLYVVPIREAWVDRLAAVAHVDGTARLQTVEREVDPLFWGLLRAFEKESGVPVILNTSFNVMGEPIVCTPEDAVACYDGTGIDALALGPCWVEKPE